VQGAIVWWQYLGEQADEGGFARAIGAQQAKDAALGYVQAQVLQRHMAAIGLAKVPNCYHNAAS
jgi:hypothetical protein